MPAFISFSTRLAKKQFSTLWVELLFLYCGRNSNPKGVELLFQGNKAFLPSVQAIFEVCIEIK